MREHPNGLLARENGGLRVELAHLPLVDLTGIQVSTDTEMFWVTVEREKALDAFHHPALYLGDEQLRRLGLVRA